MPDDVPASADDPAPADAAPAPAASIPAAVRERLRTVRGFVFDMDGTLVLGDPRGRGLAPLPGALEITRWLTDHSVPFVVCTNGTARTPQHYAAKLRDAGFGVTDAAVVTPATSAAAVLREQGHRRVMVLGQDGVVRPLQEAGIETLAPDGDGSVAAVSADAVLVGWYREFTMDTLEAACRAVWGGAELYSCSQSKYFATADGKTMGTSRAITAMITSVTDCRVQIVGKPSLEALRVAGAHLGVRTEDLAVVGDDPDLEVPMAHLGRALAIAVGTGIGTAESYAHLPEAQRPHLSVPGLDELLAVYQQITSGADTIRCGK